MSEDPKLELIAAIHSLVDQTANEGEHVTARLTSTLAAGSYLHALTNALIADARDLGLTWDQIGEALGTSGALARGRYGRMGDLDA